MTAPIAATGLCWDAPGRAWLEAACATEGFALSGIAAVPAATSDAAKLEAARYAAWIGEGRAGDMQWLARQDDAGELVRGDLLRAFPWARSVVVCAANYNAAEPLSIDPAARDAGWIARYAWSGQGMSGGDMSHGAGNDGAGNDGDMRHGGERSLGADYHDVLLPRLQRIEAGLHGRFGSGLQTRAYVDTGPVVERSYAVRAGLGWTGRNTCLLNQGQGSWLLLGVIVCSATLEQAAWGVPAADRCGTCTRCLDACPTAALDTPYRLDASRCIAYLTIEHKGSIAEELRAPMGRQVFGCDICQDVCPWNRRAPVGTMLPVRAELVNPPLRELAALTTAEFRARFNGSALERTGRNRLLRNVAIAIGNSGDRTLADALEPLEASASAMVREAAAWARTRLIAEP